ncbi:hypothetical protein Vafri_412, partial [Volvox africanus]
MAPVPVDPIPTWEPQAPAVVAAGPGAAVAAITGTIRSAGLATAEGAVAGGTGGLGPIAEAASLKMSELNAPVLPSKASRSQTHTHSHFSNTNSAQIRFDPSPHTQVSAVGLTPLPPPSSAATAEPSGVVPQSPYLCPPAAGAVADDLGRSCLVQNRLSTGGTAATLGSTAQSHSAIALWLAELPDPLGSSAASFSAAGSRAASFAQRYRALSRIALMYSTSGIGFGGLSGLEAAGLSIGGGGGGDGGGSVRSPARPSSRCSVADTSPCPSSAPRNNSPLNNPAAMFRSQWHLWSQGRVSAGITSGAATGGGSGMSSVVRSMPCGGGSLTSQMVMSNDVDVISSSPVRQRVPVPAATAPIPFSSAMPLLDPTVVGERSPAPTLAQVSDSQTPLPTIALYASQGLPDEQIVEDQHLTSSSLPTPANTQSACPPHLPRRQQQLLQHGSGGSAAAAAAPGDEGMAQVPTAPSPHPAAAATEAAAGKRQEYGHVGLQVVRLAQYYRAAYKVVNVHGQLMSYFKSTALLGSRSTRGGGGGGGSGDAAAASGSTFATVNAALSRSSTGNPVHNWADGSKPASCMPRVPARPPAAVAAAAAAAAAAAEAAEVARAIAGPLKRTFSDPLMAAAAPASYTKDMKTATATTPSVPGSSTTPFATATAAIASPSATAAVAVARSSRSIATDREAGAGTISCNAATAATAGTSPIMDWVGKWRLIRQTMGTSVGIWNQGSDQQRQLQLTGTSLQHYQQQLQARRRSRLSLALGEEPKGCRRGSGSGGAGGSGNETPTAKFRTRMAETSSFVQARRGRTSFSRESSGLFRSKSILEAEGRTTALFSGLGAFPPDASDEEPEPERAQEDITEGVSTRYQGEMTGDGAVAEDSSRRWHGSGQSSRQLLQRSAAVAAAAVAAIVAAAAAPLRMSLTSLGAAAMAGDNYADNEMEVLLADIGVLVQRWVSVGLL